MGLGGGGGYPPQPVKIPLPDMQIVETPQILGGRPIFGLYRGNFGLFCPRKPPPPQPNLAAHV